MQRFRGEWRISPLTINIQEIRDHPYLRWQRNNILSPTVHDILCLNLPNATDKWNWTLLSKHIDIQEIRDNPHLSWDKACMSSNKGITISDVLHLDLVNATRDWDSLSQNISMDDVRENPDLPWNREILSCNPGISIDDVLYLELPNATGKWNWKEQDSSVEIEYTIDMLLDSTIEHDWYDISLHIK